MTDFWRLKKGRRTREREKERKRGKKPAGGPVAGLGRSAAIKDTRQIWPVTPEQTGG